MNTSRQQGRRKPRRRRCSHCDELFSPDPRVGKRQRYCSQPDCQRERKRVYQARFRRRHPADERGNRLRDKIVAAEARAAAYQEAKQNPDSDQPAPSYTVHQPTEMMRQIPWDEVRTEFGVGPTTALEFIISFVVRWLIRADSGRE